MLMSAFRLVAVASIALGLLMLPVLLNAAAQAGQADVDYETIAAPTSDPPGLAESPLNIPDHPVGPHPKMRFVMRDGTVMIGQVLAFDGQMYALWLPHGTMLVRKDLFTSITTVRQGEQKKPTRPARAHKAHMACAPAARNFPFGPTV